MKHFNSFYILILFLYDNTFIKGDIIKSGVFNRKRFLITLERLNFTTAKQILNLRPVTRNMFFTTQRTRATGRSPHPRVINWSLSPITVFSL